MHVRTTATELAQWLEQQGGAWHVEGEPVLAKSLPLPTPASSLVEVLRRRSADGSELAMLAPETAALAADARISACEIATAAHVIDGQRVFQLAWIRPDGTVADSWLLAEQESKPASAGDGAAARGVVAAFRAATSTRSTRGTPR
jgi:hypothetical protein